MAETVRLTVAQAVVRFLANQWSERDGERQRLFAGIFGIFGHGNVAGVGQALLQDELAFEGHQEDNPLPYVLARNEQAMVHTAVGYARQRDRLQTWACTASVGPGSTNMLTGAALATINRIPVLLLPSGTFATRVAAPVLQELEQPYAADLTVNDAFRPLSRFFDRVSRPEQLPSALLGGMRVLTDPVETGAVTIVLPQDVQAEAHDWPVELFAERTWHVARPPAEASRVSGATSGSSPSPREDFLAFFTLPRADDDTVQRLRNELRAAGVGRSLFGAAALPVVRARRGRATGGGALLEAGDRGQCRARGGHHELRAQRQPAPGGCL